MRRGEEPLEVLGARDRETLEDAASVVVDGDDRQRHPGATRGDEASEIVEKREVAGEQQRRPARRRGDAERGRGDSVDAVGAPVGEDANAPLRARGMRVEIAN